VWGCWRTLSTFSSHTLRLCFAGLAANDCRSPKSTDKCTQLRRFPPPRLGDSREIGAVFRAQSGSLSPAPQNYGSSPGSFATLAAISRALLFVPWQIVATPVPG